MKFLFIASLMTFLVACGQQQETTQARISVASVKGSSKYPGGIVVFARRMETGERVVLSIVSDSVQSFELPNGTWRFFVVGWKGSGTGTNKIYSGDALCGFRMNEKLAGAKVDLQFSLNPAACRDFYKLNGGSSTIGAIEIYDEASRRFIGTAVSSCNGIKSFIDVPGVDPIPTILGIGVDKGCDGNNGPQAGDAKAFRVNFMHLNLNGDLKSGLWSGCREFTSSYRNYTDLNLPPSFIQSPIRIEYGTYATLADCQADLVLGGTDNMVQRYRFGAIDSAALVRPEDQLNGYINFDPVDESPTNTFHTQFDPVFFVALDGAQGPACSDDDKLRLPFARGARDDDNGDPRYFICSKEQWANIGVGVAACDDNDGNDHPDMDCEPEAEYVLLEDIDFEGSNSTILVPFKGKLRGNGNSLLNGNSPLFDNIQSPSVGFEETFVRDLTIDGFDIDSANQYVGAIANTVTSSGVTDTEGVSVNSVRLVNSTVDSSSLTAGGVGGYFGLVNFSSAASGEYFSMRENFTSANVTGVSAQALHGSDPTNTFSVGGFIGVLIGSSIGGGAYLEVNSIGYDSGINDNPFDVIHSPVKVEGVRNVGGFAGSMQDAEIRLGNIAKVDLEGQEVLGGLVGRAYEGTDIHDSQTIVRFLEDTTDFCTGNGVCRDIGGVIGVNSSSGSVKIKGTVSNFELLPTTYWVQRVGGVAGTINEGSMDEINFSDLRSSFDFHANGKYIGGIIGHANFISGGNFDIIASSVNVSIDEASIDDLNNQYRGGVMGISNQSEVSRVVVTGFGGNRAFIKGGRWLGGYAGSLKGNTSEVFVEVDIESSNNGTANVGGFAGQIAVGGVAPRNRDFIVHAEIDMYNSVSNCGARSCGILTGSNLNVNTVTFGYGMQVGSIIRNDDSDVTAVCGSGNCDVGNTGTDEFHDTFASRSSGDCTTLNSSPNFRPFVDDGGTCRQAFEFAWFRRGYDVDDDIYLAGSMWEPFPIETAADWNDIDDDAFLCHKSFEVIGEVDFGGGAMDAICNGASNFAADNHFSGTIFGEGRLVDGVVSVGSQLNGGLVNSIENGQLGTRQQSLKLHNIAINCSSIGTACGLVGSIKNGKAFVKATNVFVTTSGTTTGAAGGIVGEIQGNVEIVNTLFRGGVAAGSATNAGGIVGFVTAGADIDISDTGVDVASILAGQNAGGIIGSVQSTGKIKNSYVWLDLGNINGGNDIDSASIQGGLVGRMLSNNFEFQGNYVDVSAAQVPASFFYVAEHYSGSASSISDTGMVGVYDQTLDDNDSDPLTGYVWETTFQVATQAGLGGFFTSNDDWEVVNGRYVRAWEVEQDGN